MLGKEELFVINGREFLSYLSCEVVDLFIGLLRLGFGGVHEDLKGPP